MKKILISAVILIIIIIIFIASMVSYINNNIKDKGGMENENMKNFPLQTITYTISGDSIDSYSSKQIQHFEDYDLLTVTSRESLNSKSVTKEYKLPNDTLLKFTDIISKYDYKNWKNLPKSDDYALDAGIHSISIQFLNNEIYAIDKYKVLPKNEENLFEIVIEFLNEKMKNNF